MSLNNYLQKLHNNKVKNKIYKKYGLGGNFMLLAIVFIICGLIGGLREARVTFSLGYKSTTATIVSVVKEKNTRHSTSYEVLSSFKDKDGYNTIVTFNVPVKVSAGDEVPILYKKSKINQAVYGSRLYHFKKVFWYLIFIVGGGLIAIKSKKSIDNHTQAANMQM